MIHLAIYSSLTAAIISAMASIHAERGSERHTFAWISAIFMLKMALLMTGLMDDVMDRYMWDIFLSITFTGLALWAMVRVPKCRLF